MTAPVLRRTGASRFVRNLSLAALLAALFAGFVAPTAAAASVAAPSAPTITSVHDYCDLSGCDDALDAYYGWDDLGWPTNRTWYYWGDGLYNFSGGVYKNLEGELPAGDHFQEYDVYPRDEGAPRDAHRIILDVDTGDCWYSPDHYSNFYEIV